MNLLDCYLLAVKKYLPWKRQDDILVELKANLESQLEDKESDLGGGVIKQRIARAGSGKSGGSRSIILFRKNDRAVYVYGFEKKDVANIRTNELEASRELAQVILGYTPAEIAKRVEDGALFEVKKPKEENDA